MVFTRTTWPTQVVSFSPLTKCKQVLGIRDEIERHWKSAAVLKVVTPQLGSRKLPLHVPIILKKTVLSLPLLH